jgi:hypothetical protein
MSPSSGNSATVPWGKKTALRRSFPASNNSLRKTEHYHTANHLPSEPNLQTSRGNTMAKLQQGA